MVKMSITVYVHCTLEIARVTTRVFFHFSLSFKAREGSFYKEGEDKHICSKENF